ncbi:contactin-3-like isoform X1 [Branchiostoma floridae]|uniref:Contactin-3-like isoform X1 n=1 Tax=Branchiostoma floridae TaxID=7739 RepID=A0A9J7N134_BRAFL|nr:contactin-3-like isoform X1 [Branchiostoma floridae]XP_035687486.1 contactin-3-like isoform X1 [Branchiostoma floridae]
MGFQIRLLSLLLSSVFVTFALNGDSADDSRQGPPERDAHPRERIAYRTDLAILPCTARRRSSTTTYSSDRDDVKMTHWHQPPNIPDINNNNDRLYEWKKDDQEVILTPSKYKIVDGELHILSPRRPDDEGKYQCIAYNEDGAKISLPTYLRIAYMEPFEPTVRLPIVVNEGDTFRIRCVPPDHYPSGKYNWYKDVPHQLVQQDKRIFISNKNGDLFFRYATLQDSGNYSCVLSDDHPSHGYYIVHSPATSVVVRPGSITSRPPHVVLSPEIVHAVEGQTVTMQCFDDAYPVSKTVWKRRVRKEDIDELPLPRNAVLQSHDHLLVLPDVRRESAGYYFCEVENELGRSNILARLSVNVPAKVTSLGKDIPLRLGNDVTLEATFEGTSPVTVTWYRNANEVVTNSKYVIKGDALTITDLRFTDRGRYQCMVQNEYGADQVFFNLVAVEPTIVKPMKDAQTAILGETATVVVRWEASPPFMINWRQRDTTVVTMNMDDKRAVLVTIINHRMNVTKEGYLSINDVTAADEGNYTFSVSNQFGHTEASNQLLVIAPPTAQSASNIPLLAVGAILALLIIVGAAVVVWVVMKRRRDRVSSPIRPDAAIVRPNADEAFRVRLYIDDNVAVNEDFGTDDTRALTEDL